MIRNDLVQFADRKREIKNLEGIIQRIRTQMESPFVINASRVPGGGSHDSNEDRIATLMDKMEALYVRYSDLWKERIALQNRIEDALVCLSPRERDVIRMKYFAERSWVSISMELGCSDRHAQRILAHAENKLSGFSDSPSAASPISG